MTSSDSNSEAPNCEKLRMGVYFGKSIRCQFNLAGICLNILSVCCDESWCVGRNPPLVFCGIRLIGLPAPPVERSLATVCPFHLQDSRFNASNPAHSALDVLHRHVRLDVSFLLRCQASRLLPSTGNAILRVGGVSSDPSRIRGPTATHRLASPTKKAYATK